MKLNNLPNYNNEDLTRIWQNQNGIKVFISHRDTHKIEAYKIKEMLNNIGISSFVAHVDIVPTEHWVNEILIALQSMDIFLAYISSDFFNSIYTNQEVGFALGNNKPIIPFKHDIDPAGFISSIQARNYVSDNFIDDFIHIVLNSRFISPKTINKLSELLINDFKNSYSFDSATVKFKRIENIKCLSQSHIQEIINSFNSNDQIYGCFYLNGFNLRGRVNEGLICAKLREWTNKEYEIVRVPFGLKLQEKSNS